MTDLRKSIHGREFGLGPDGELVGNLIRMTRPSVDCSITVGDEVADARAITIQLLNNRGEAVSEYENLHVFVFADAAGAALATTGGSTGIAIGADGILLATLTTKKAFIFRTKSNGSLKLTWTDTATEAAYLAVELPSGRKVFSTALTNA